MLWRFHMLRGVIIIKKLLEPCFKYGITGAGGFLVTQQLPDSRFVQSCVCLPPSILPLPNYKTIINTTKKEIRVCCVFRQVWPLTHFHSIGLLLNILAGKSMTSQPEKILLSFLNNNFCVSFLGPTLKLGSYIAFREKGVRVCRGIIRCRDPEQH